MMSLPQWSSLLWVEVLFPPIFKGCGKNWYSLVLQYVMIHGHQVSNFYYINWEYNLEFLLWQNSKVLFITMLVSLSVWQSHFARMKMIYSKWHRQTREPDLTIYNRDLIGSWRRVINHNLWQSLLRVPHYSFYYQAGVSPITFEN